MVVRKLCKYCGWGLAKKDGFCNTQHKKDYKAKKSKIWHCVLCGINYIHDGEELAIYCMWRHIFKKDEHYQKLNKPNVRKSS